MAVIVYFGHLESRRFRFSAIGVPRESIAATHTAEKVLLSRILKPNSLRLINHHSADRIFLHVLTYSVSP